MSRSEYIHKLAELSGKADSAGMHRVLECAMTDDEAKFLLDLPAPTAELAEKYGVEEPVIEAMIHGLAERGLVVSSRKGIRFPRNPTTLHDNILASAPEHIPEGMDRHWMQMYEDEGWAEEIGNMMVDFGTPAIRTIPVLGSLLPQTELPPHEDIEAILRANADLISLRHCCCRTGAQNCAHPNEVCIQFGKRAEYDLYRGSGRKISADEAIAVAKRAGESGLVPTVTNMSRMEVIDFICFCCGCCCLIIDPARRVNALQKILAPSRFLSVVDEELCDGCGKCPKRCPVDAIQMEEALGFDEEKAVIDADQCVGCGACIPACPIDGAMRMDEIRTRDFVPEKLSGPSSVLHM